MSRTWSRSGQDTQQPRSRFAPWFAPRSLARSTLSLLIFLVGFVLGQRLIEPAPLAPPTAQSCSRDRSAGPRLEARDAFGIQEVGPTSYRHDVPVGFVASEAGARAAGVAYASEVEQEMFYLSDGAIDQATRQISAVGRAEELGAARHEGIAKWRAALASGLGQVWWVVAPLASRVESFTGEGARVSVWVTYVVSRSGATSPRVWFGTQTIDLVRQNDDWKVSSQSLDPGPTPQAAAAARPTDASELNERLEGFQTVGASR